MKKYQEIFNILRDKIINGHYQAGDLLPTEKELQETYSVSRDTIRKALGLLTENGLIQKIQGRGSQVLKQELLDFPISGLTSYKEVTEALQVKTQTKVISLDEIEIDRKLSELTGFPQGSIAWRVLRTRVIDGVVVVLDLDYLSQEFVPELSVEVAEDSIYAYLEGPLGLDISYAQKDITVQPTTSQERDLLESGDDYLVLIRSRVYLGDTRQFQYTESKHKVDRFRFIDFARRRQSF